MDDSGSRVKATIIDLGLSRMTLPGVSGSTSLNQFTELEDAIFESEGM